MGWMKSGMKTAAAMKVGQMIYEQMQDRKRGTGGTGGAGGTFAGSSFLNPFSTGGSAPAPAPTPDPTDANLARLKQLGELRDAGVLTPEEFEREKAKILGG